MKLKVLPLTFPFNSPKEWWEDCVKDTNRIEPILHRNGYYLDRTNNLTWLEIDGEAWKYGDREHFQCELDHSKGNNRIHPEVYKALGTLIRHRLADARIWKLYSIENQMRALRHIHLEARLSSISLLKEE